MSDVDKFSTLIRLRICNAKQLCIAYDLCLNKCLVRLFFTSKQDLRG